LGILIDLLLGSPPQSIMEGLDPNLPKNVRTPKKLRLPIKISNKTNMIAFHSIILGKHYALVPLKQNYWGDTTSSLRKVAIIDDNNTNKIID